ncbi:MAG: mechanosensitive ion channel family protein [Acidobacteriota bacterium]
MFDFLSEEYRPFLIDAGTSIAHSALRIALVVLGGYIGVRVLRAALKRMEDVLVAAREKAERVPGATRKRVATLTGLLTTLGAVLVWSVVVVICLGQIGVDIGPILAGAGVLGLAVGFGAQNLVRDLISGFFLVLEDQIRVGDVAIVNGTGGLVEAVTFRTIILRDLSGVVHVFPNGTINTLSNMTKEWSGYVLDIGVAYKEDTDRVVEVMKQVDEELRNDPDYDRHILQPIEVFGVDAFGSSEVVIKARIKTQPIQQWFVGREYRRRLKKAFDAKGIEIPFPHHSIYMGEASKPFEVLLKQAPGGPRPPAGS